MEQAELKILEAEFDIKKMEYLIQDIFSSTGSFMNVFENNIGKLITAFRLCEMIRQWQLNYEMKDALECLINELVSLIEFILMNLTASNEEILDLFFTSDSLSNQMNLKLCDLMEEFTSFMK